MMSDLRTRLSDGDLPTTSRASTRGPVVALDDLITLPARHTRSVHVGYEY